MLGQESSGDADRYGAGGPASIPELLWVESVSERLLGAGTPTRPWEQAYFAAESGGEAPSGGGSRPAEVAAAGTLSRSATTGHVPPSLVGRTAEGRPLLDLTIEEQQQIRAAVASTESELAAQHSADVAGRALRLALGDPEHELSSAVLSLLAEQAEDRARLQRLQTAVDVMLEQVEPAQAALLRQLLHGS